MSGALNPEGVPLYPWTDQQKVDIRRWCGYPEYGTGTVVFPYPWIMRYYLALETRLDTTTADEGATIVSVFLTPLANLEMAIPGASPNLATDEAAPWKHNKNEVRDRVALFDEWRHRLCDMLGVPPGPYLVDRPGASRISTIRIVV